jgi:aspartate kinase
MNIKILKFGGTSLANNYKLSNVANIIKAHMDINSKIIVVVSAKAGHTNELIARISEIQGTNYIDIDKEYDAALASAENLSASLLSITLKLINIKAQSLQAWQVPIFTDNNFGKSKIIKIGNEKILSLLNQNIIPIITGFQGVTEQYDITTLGRGGSDTTGAAVASSLNANICYIYTDVDGVYSGDPRIIKNAKKLTRISYEEMLEFADSGAKVITSRAVRICMNALIPIEIKSSFEEIEGTLITSEEKIMEKSKITGITNNSDIAVIYLYSEYKENIEIISQLSESNIHLISIIYHQDNTEIIIPLSEYNVAISKLENIKTKYDIRTNLSLVSIIGRGIKHDSQIVSKILSYLKTLEINIHSFISSEFKVSILIEESYASQLQINFHSEFIENEIF